MPEVILDFHYRSGLVYIVVENIGESPAYSVRVKFDKKVIGVEGDKVISSMRIFKALKFLPPDKKIRIFVDTFASYLARKQPLLLQAAITYRDKCGKRFENIINHDLSIYKGLTEA